MGYSFKDDLIKTYLGMFKKQLTLVPKYIPDTVVPVYKLLWEKIMTEDNVFNLALEKLYINQTKDEQDAYITKYKNFIGFNKSEAQYLSKMFNIMQNQGLNDMEKVTCLPALRKYLTQLLMEKDFMYVVRLKKEYDEIICPHLDYLEMIRRNG